MDPLYKSQNKYGHSKRQLKMHIKNRDFYSLIDNNI